MGRLRSSRTRPDRLSQPRAQAAACASTGSTTAARSGTPSTSPAGEPRPRSGRQVRRGGRPCPPATPSAVCHAGQDARSRSCACAHCPGREICWKLQLKRAGTSAVTETWLGRPAGGSVAFPSDLEIARGAALKPLDDVAAEIGIASHLLEPYGEQVVKIKLAAIEELADRPTA